MHMWPPTIMKACMSLLSILLNAACACIFMNIACLTFVLMTCPLMMHLRSDLAFMTLIVTCPLVMNMYSALALFALISFISSAWHLFFQMPFQTIACVLPAMHMWPPTIMKACMSPLPIFVFIFTMRSVAFQNMSLVGIYPGQNHLGYVAAPIPPMLSTIKTPIALPCKNGPLNCCACAYRAPIISVVATAVVCIICCHMPYVAYNI